MNARSPRDLHPLFRRCRIREKHSFRSAHFLAALEDEEVDSKKILVLETNWSLKSQGVLFTGTIAQLYKLINNDIDGK